MVPRDSQKRPNWTLKSTLGDHKDVKNGEKCNLKKHTRKYNGKVQESYPPKPQKVWFRVHETRVFQNRLVQKKLPKLCQNGTKMDTKMHRNPLKRPPNTIRERIKKARRKKLGKSTSNNPVACKPDSAINRKAHFISFLWLRRPRALYGMSSENNRQLKQHEW